MYYTYLWLREDGTPYYVGKGKGNRAFTSNGHGVHKPKHKERVVIYPAESERDAFEAEIALIWYYGRRDLGTGCLRNLTDGGEGSSGVSEASRKKMSDAKKGHTSWNSGLVGLKLSPEVCKRMSIARTRCSDEAIAAAYNSSVNYEQASKLVGMQPSPFGKRCRALGLTSKVRKYVKKTATCHPSVEHYGKGLCHACYMAQYQKCNRDTINSYKREWNKTQKLSSAQR